MLIGLGQWAPALSQAIGHMEVAKVNLPVGLLIWVMIIPMLVKVDFGALHEVKQHVRGIGVTLFVNWLVKPFSMAFLGWLFIRNWFAPGFRPSLLFAFQGKAILGQPLVIALLAVLIEVPAMLLVVKVVNESKGWYEAR